MKTLLTLTPNDHGRHVTAEEWESAEPHNKLWKYEVIDGVIAVAPPPNFGHDLAVDWLHLVFTRYRLANPQVVNHITQQFAVRVPNRPDLTEAQPDCGLYCLPEIDDPHEVAWADIQPFLVVEVLSEGQEEKDMVRNVELYRLVAGIREYWIVDPIANAWQPRLTVYRKRGSRWQKPIEVAFGETYTTPRLLPGFCLVVDPRAPN